MKIALITGGTSGIGLAIAKRLDNMGYKLLLVGSRTVYKEIENYRDATYYSLDLRSIEAAEKLLNLTEDQDIDLFINNAGFGDIGSFLITDTDKEMDMIDLNCKSMQYLLKGFLKRFTKLNRGKILVTSSAAAFSPSGYMATYYATKAYILHLVLGYRQELKDLKSKVTISALCPGPVDTNFQKRADVVFSLKPLSADFVAKIAIKGLIKGKAIIVPTLKIKFLTFLSKLFPMTFATKIISKSARKRRK